MAKKVAGSNKSFTVDGITFDVMADANITEVFTGFENSMIPTSGKHMYKKVKRVEIREGIVLATDAAEREQLKSFAESLDILQLQYVNAAGDNFQCEGAIEVENNETEENRTTVQGLPQGTWTLFEG
jgi:hypothetical protein